MDVTFSPKHMNPYHPQRYGWCLYVTRTARPGNVKLEWGCLHFPVPDWKDDDANDSYSLGGRLSNISIMPGNI